MSPSGTGRDAGLCSTVFCWLLTAVQRDSERSVREGGLGGDASSPEFKLSFHRPPASTIPYLREIVFMFLHEPRRDNDSK